MNAQLTWGTYLETCWAFADGTFLPYMSLFLKKLAVRTKCKSIKVMDQGDWKTDLLSLDSSPERPAEQSPQNLKKRSSLWRLCFCNVEIPFVCGLLNEDAKGSISKTTILHVHHAFLYISLSSLQDYDVKVLNFTMYRGSRQAKTRFPLSFWNWIWFLGIQL